MKGEAAGFQQLQAQHAFPTLMANCPPPALCGQSHELTPGCHTPGCSPEVTVQIYKRSEVCGLLKIKQSRHFDTLGSNI